MLRATRPRCPLAVHHYLPLRSLAVMKFLALLALVSAALATPLSLYEGTAQTPLSGDLPLSYPGFDLDLNELRLVQVEGRDEPVVMSELQKARICARPAVAFLTASLTCRHLSH